MMDTKKLRQKILDLAIRGKLVPQDPNDEPASVLLERIREEKERLIKEGKIKRSKTSAANNDIEPPFEIPESWEWTTIGEICDTCLGKMLDKQKNQGECQPYLRNINVRWGSFDLEDLLQMPFTEDEEERYSVCKGDLIVCEGGEPGRCAIWEDEICIKFQKALHRVRCYNGVVNKYIMDVLRLYASNGRLENYYTGSTIKHLTGESLNSLIIPLPPFAEQQRIVNEIERWFAVIDELESNEADLQKTIDKAKSKILDLAIHGKLVPQDPNDEPASLLLEQIREEKNRLANEGKLQKKDLEEKTIDEDEIPFYIPDSWEWVRIGSIFNHSSGKQLNASDTEGSLLEYITTSNLYWGRFELNNLKSMYYKDSEVDKCTAKQGDLLVCEGGDIGRSAIWPYDYDICLQNHIHRLRSYVSGNAEFAYYIMWNYKNSGQIGGKGIAIQGLSASALKSIIIPLPPLAEQKRIVAKIEELFAVLDSISAS